MKCDQCQTENKDGAKFCAKCGTVLSAIAAKPTAETRQCPTCGKALKLDAKFCGGCGHKFEQAVSAQEPTVEIAVKQPEVLLVQPEIKTTPPVKMVEQVKQELAPESAKTCPKCGKALKFDAKFCGGCGHNFLQATSAAILEPNATLINREETKSGPAEIIIASPPKKIVEPANPKSMPENVPAEKSGNKFNDVSKVKKGLPIAVIAGGIGVVVVIVAGSGFFYYKSHNGQAVAAKIEQVPTVLSQPASAQAPVAVIPPSSIPASSTAPVSVAATVQTAAPVVAPVVEPATPAAASEPKKPKVHAKQKGETLDDKKLLNAIDQYMDKQK